MNSYEELLIKVQKEVPVFECNLEEYGGAGFYALGCIYIDNHQKDYEKHEILAEEYGHYKTSVGDILSQKIPLNRKQEKKARTYAMDLILPIEKIIHCLDACCTNYFECAEFLGVSQEFFMSSIAYHATKLGNHALFYKGKQIHFDESSIYAIDFEKSA